MTPKQPIMPNNVQRHVSNLGPTNPPQNFPPMARNPTNPMMQKDMMNPGLAYMPQPVIYVTPNNQGMPVYNPYNPVVFNPQLPQLPYVAYPPQQQYVYYQPPINMPRPSLTPMSTRTFDPNQQPKFPSFQSQQQPFSTPPIAIDSKEYQPPKLKEVQLALPPPIPESPFVKERPHLLYNNQKPKTADGLKHPSDKYKDLIYRPRYITSRNIEPPTENLIPKIVEEDVLPPLDTTKSRTKLNLEINLKLSGRKPTLVNDLKLPVSKVIKFFGVFLSFKCFY